MRERAESDGCAARLRERVERGEEVTPESEATTLLRSGFSAVETGLVLAGGLGVPLADIQLLFVRIAAQERGRPDT